MSSEFLALVYGIASAISWGAGDFTGGFACRRTNVYSVVLFSQLAGLASILLLAWGFHEPVPASANWLFPGIAGIAGALGLMALYSALASGRMGIVAPLSAVITAVLPVCVGLVTDGLPGWTTMLGFGLALPAVWLLTRTEQHEAIHMREIYLALLAGGGFGLFFTLMGQAENSAVTWSLVAARIASLSILVVVALVFKQGRIPDTAQIPPILLAGLLDTGGNAFFMLAAQAGRLDISAVLASLYPASTVILARFVLKEHVCPYQWSGIGIALLAILLIAL